MCQCTPFYCEPSFNFGVLVYVKYIYLKNYYYEGVFTKALVILRTKTKPVFGNIILIDF